MPAAWTLQVRLPTPQHRARLGQRSRIAAGRSAQGPVADKVNLRRVFDPGFAVRLDPGDGIPGELPGACRVTLGERHARLAGEIIHSERTFGIQLAPRGQSPRKGLGCLVQRPAICQRVAEMGEREADAAAITDRFLNR